jgi:flavin-dependent dehydrogenase
MRHRPAIYFGYVPWGYAWSFPGDRHRSLGIVGLNRKRGKYLLSGFASFLESLNILQQNIPALKSHALPYGNYLARPGFAKVLLLGDACGLADPLLGEGIYYAHKSAALAARAVVKSFSNPPDVLSTYTRDLTRDVIAELKVIRLARQILFSMPANWRYRLLSCLLRGLPRLCEETVHGQRSYRWFRPLPLKNIKRSGNAKVHSAL